MSRSLLLACLLAMGLAIPASGVTHHFSCTDCGGSSGAGVLKSIDASYDDVSQDLFWQATFLPNASGVTPDGAWLVVTPGPNPKGDGSDYAILYMDGVNEIVTSYAYTGQNNSWSSYQDPGDYLASHMGGVAITTDPFGAVTLTMAVNVAGENAAFGDDPERGIRWGEKIGVWFHPSAGSVFSYTDAPFGDGAESDVEQDGLAILDYDYKSQGWYDVGNKPTSSVPEPTAALLFAAGVLAVGRSTRRRV